MAKNDVALRDAGAVQVEAANETSALLSMIERVARDPTADIDKIERLYAMHERAETSRKQVAYNAAMSATQSEMEPIVKNKENTHTGARYADLFAIADKALPIANAHGLALSFSQYHSEEPNCIGIECHVMHAAGHSEKYRYDVPVDAAGSGGKVNKTATQAFGSTFTYGRRYAVMNVFNIAVTDNDGNAATLSDTQVKAIEDLLKQTGANREAFLGMGGFENVTDIPQSQFNAAIAKLKMFSKQVKK